MCWFPNEGCYIELESCKQQQIWYLLCLMRIKPLVAL